MSKFSESQIDKLDRAINKLIRNSKYANCSSAGKRWDMVRAESGLEHSDVELEEMHVEMFESRYNYCDQFDV